ncbi:hypothetical protein [Klebsiella electrica]|uniref:hypothetical protein n=1 Tax=Klebsiella electrica TaxID=1259973 RepID=UPI00114E066B|nr:hypothetical protein [Klebsiella electrica]
MSGLIAWRIARGGPVALAPFTPRWRCAYRGYGWCGVWLDRLAYCLRGACGTGAVCSPVALCLPGLRGCGAWLDRLAYCLRAGLWHWRRLLPGGAVLTGATGGCGAWLYRLAYCPRGACGTGAVCSPVALRLPGLRVGAVLGIFTWRIACGRACGTGAVCSPMALCLPGLRVGAVSGLIAWRIACGRACGTGAVCSPVALCLPGLRAWCGVWLDRLAHCLRAGLWHWRRLLPGGAVLTGATRVRCLALSPVGEL